MAQLRAILAYIKQFNPHAAEAVARHLLAAANGLEHCPHLGRPVAYTGMRELVTAYRYVIRYRVTRDATVHILRIRHTSRRPTKP